MAHASRWLSLGRIGMVVALLTAQPALAQFGPAGPPPVGVLVAARQPVTESTEFVVDSARELGMLHGFERTLTRETVTRSGSTWISRR
jgi:hypothetical protein